MENEIIKTRQLTKHFDTVKNSIPVIDRLDLSIHKGQFTVVMGSSGSGKSTLLYLLSGLDKPSSGQIWIDKIPVHDRNERDLAVFRRTNIGFIFQDNNLIPSLTIRENILVAGFLVGKNSTLIRQRADSLMEDLEILHLADRIPAEVSGGELQRCAIARALINDPLILLADEPTGSLNSQASTKVLDCLKQFHNKGQSIVMVTHDIKSAIRGERVLFLKDGIVDNEFTINKENDRRNEQEGLFDWLNQHGW